jgi:hypothetical protein
MSGVLIFLLELFDNKINKIQVQHLIEGAVNYILSQEIDYNKYNSYFPLFSLENKNGFDGSRFSWCYEDLGICFALWRAGITLGNESWQIKALDILSHEARFRRNLNKSGIKDACFCHGTVGVAHIYYRMWLYTKNEYFKDAADFWYNETLKMSKFLNGLAGYKAYYDKDKGYVNPYDLLNGIAGIGLSLIFYHLGKSPCFDNCFLLS